MRNIYICAKSAAGGVRPQGLCQGRPGPLNSPCTGTKVGPASVDTGARTNRDFVNRKEHREHRAYKEYRESRKYIYIYIWSIGSIGSMMSIRGYREYRGYKEYREYREYREHEEYRKYRRQASGQRPNKHGK